MLSFQYVHLLDSQSICITISSREKQSEDFSECLLNVIYANIAYLVNVSKISHSTSIHTAMRCTINVRAFRHRDFTALSHNPSDN